MMAGLILSAAAAAWLRYELASAYYDGGTEVFVEIPRGASSGAIAESLRAAGVVRHAWPLILYLRWTGLSRKLRAGEYRFTDPARPGEIVFRLVQGDVYYRTITIPEGLTALETASLIASHGLAPERELSNLVHRIDWISDLDPHASSLEGYLFPETYRFPRHITAEEILKAMVAQFRSRITPIMAQHGLPPGRTLPQIVTLASMIEKEARTDEERLLVSSVLHNRLRIGMPLACDPTIIYALKLKGTYDGNLHKADLAFPSPYNTYLNAGLPPGPIANPGVASLEAAFAPATSEFLYYVSRNDGTHVFSRDYRSHQLAVDRFQKHR
jgi:UPF0755 protein